MAFQKPLTVFAVLLGLAAIFGNASVAKADDVKVQAYQVPDSPDAQSDTDDTAQSRDDQTQDSAASEAPDDGYTPPPEENDSAPETALASGQQE